MRSLLQVMTIASRAITPLSPPFGLSADAELLI